VRGVSGGPTPRDTMRVNSVIASVPGTAGLWRGVLPALTTWWSGPSNALQAGAFVPGLPPGILARWADRIG
jgi:hypothetical protein